MYEDKKIALVLSGGGAKGAYQSAVVNRIQEELNLKFDVVAGVSVGALNASMIAQGKYDELAHIWRTIKNKDVYEKHWVVGKLFKFLLHKIGLAKSPMGMYSNKPLKKMVEKHLEFDKLETNLLIGKVNINDYQYSSTINRKDFVKQVIASTAIPIVWEPTKIGDQSYVDGGVRNVTPLSDVLKFNPDLIIIIPTRTFLSNKVVADEVNPESILDVAKRSLDIMMDEVFQEDVSRLLQINSMVRQAEEAGTTLYRDNGKPYKHFEALIINPYQSLGDALDFEDSRMLRINTGVKRANQVMDRLKKKLENA